MGYAKERVKFEKLAEKVGGLTYYDEKSLVIITDVFDQYSHTIRILKNKKPELFTEQYKNELEQAKLLKRTLKVSEEADRQDNFVKYRDSLLAALNTAVATLKEMV